MRFKDDNDNRYRVNFTRAMDSERITLGSGKLYCIKFTGEIPDDATIETEDNQLAHIKGGASLEYTAES